MTSVVATVVMRSCPTTPFRQDSDPLRSLNRATILIIPAAFTLKKHSLGWEGMAHNVCANYAPPNSFFYRLSEAVNELYMSCHPKLHLRLTN